uniref:BPTI/Kunitz inhibitor domain-containing protein n=1 Tax=Heterorhabditis bacteriophora TaxID=37862 RepID=A0A1I7XCK4_HETBA
MLLFPLLILLLFLIVFGSFEISFCSIGDECQSCAIKYALASSCSKEDGEQIFLFCNPRSKYERLLFGMVIMNINIKEYIEISPSESGCFYDIQCSSVWPDSSCKNGQCTCPSEDMVAVKTKDGTMCVWSTSIEPACPLPSLPPPESPAALVVLPAPASNRTVSIAACNPHSSSLPSNEEDLLQRPYEYKCAVRGMASFIVYLADEYNLDENPSPADVSDIYECIDNTLFWKSHGIDINSHPVGVCCMNRGECDIINSFSIISVHIIKAKTNLLSFAAFTCQQPKRGESDALGSVPRWWFNSVVGSCLQFLFDPNSSEVSPNNFETLDHCESFCKDSYCHRVIYSIFLYLYKVKTGYGKYVKILNNQYSAEFSIFCFCRYYYSPKDGQCYPFTYNGYLVQCPHGSPLSNGRGAPQRCRRDSECPSTHTCSTEHAVCCIRPPEPKCLQGRAYTDPSGRFLQCGESEISCPSNYECHFDGVVHGCCPMKVCPNGGSPLRFNLKAVTCSVNEHCPNGYECSQVDSNEITHGKCCPSKVTICSKPPQMGIFPKCGSSGGQTNVKIIKIPSLRASLLSCVMYETRVIRLVTNGQVVAVMISLCRLPDRVFVVKLFESELILSLFYFNIALRSCSTYKSNGCDISMNSFSSLQECENFCFSAGCKAGDMVYKDPNMNRPLLCNIALQNNCPSTFQCTFNMLTQNHVCCGSESMGICPFGEKVFIDSRTSTPLQCAMTADGRCPPGYLCRLSSTKQKYYCCGSINGS